MVNGMPNFFGRKGLGTSILRAAKRLNPIDIEHGAAARALGYINNNQPRHGSMYYEQVKSTMRGTAPKWSGFARAKTFAKGYFSGDNLSDIAHNLGMPGMTATPLAEKRKNMVMRTAVGATLGAYLGSTALFGNDNPVSTMSRTGLAVGTHTALTAAIGRKNPIAGTVYGTWAGLNAFRSGNNLGPF
jgi:hypothetical protein